MSNNTPDYENDLVFPPASADVHTAVIEKQLEIAVKALESLRTKKTVIDKVTGDVCYILDYALEQIKELDK